IESVPNRAGKPAIPPRGAWREGKRIRGRTVANLSRLPPEIVAGFRAVLGGAAAVLGTARDVGPGRTLHRTRSRGRDLALAAVAARVLWPDSRPATARRLSPETATGSLGAPLGLGEVAGNEVLSMPGWPLKRQPWIERSLANRHLRGGNALILYDVSGSHLEGTHCPPAAFGHNRDGRKGKRQITYGLLCAADGCPVAVEVFPGNTADPSTVASRVDRIRRRLRVGRVALVGDRGMLATARIRGDPGPAGLDWIPALGTADIRRPLGEGADGAPAPLVPEALVPDAVAEVTGPDFPGERLVVCLNPRPRRERHRRREALLRATEEAPRRIAASVRSGRLKGRAAIDRRVGRDVNRRRVGKHLEVGVTDGGVSWRRRKDRISAEARLDGACVIRTSLGPEAMGRDGAVDAHRSLAGGGRAFRNAKSDPRIRPVYVYSADHVKAHVFLCMLALHVEWHMRRRLAPMLSGDDDRGGARLQRSSPVEPARVSEGARDRADTKRTPDGLPVHSLRTPLDDLATLTLNRLRLPDHGDSQLTAVTTPTPARERAFGLLGVKPDRNVPIRMTGPM
ncbi:MAG: IS1634 family transposase, partial [Rhodobacter sp.]|nr:IS1634 family transposase [Rhodobacter sp.]